MKKNENFLENYILEGNELPIVTYPSAVLTKIATDVLANEIDNNFRIFLKDMLYTMYHAPGIGLAAPQIGISKRFFVIDVDYDREEKTLSNGDYDYVLSNFNPMVFINPKIIKKEGKFNYQEGCLSLPGIYEEVERAEKVTVEYLDMFGEKQTLEASGVFAVCIQHENDHLDGIVFIDRLSTLKKNFFKNKLTKQKKASKLK